jgi:hypothetical protein
MQGSFSEDSLNEALFQFVEEGVIVDFDEYFDFGSTCMRPDGTLYGTSGKCRQGTETSKAAPKKRGRQAGGKNVATTPPGEAAARMKAAYDKLVGIDLSKKPANVTADARKAAEDIIRFRKALSIVKDVPAHMPGRNEEIARLEKNISELKNKLVAQDTAVLKKALPSAKSKTLVSKITPENVIAKLEAANKEVGKWGDAMERLQGPSGSVRPADRAEWEKARDKYDQAAARYKLALDKRADYRRLHDDVMKRANEVGMQQMREKDPAKKAELEARYNKMVSQMKRMEAAFTKEGTDTWMAKMGISVRPSEMWGASPTKPVTPEAKPIVQSHRALEKEAEAKFKDWARAQSREEKAYQEVVVAKRDKADPAKIEELRKAYREKVKENDDAERVWREANRAAIDAANKGQTLLERESDRYSVKQLKRDAKDYLRMKNGMERKGEDNTDLAVVKAGLEARKNLIKIKKDLQDEHIVASMNRSQAAKALHNLNFGPRQIAAVRLQEMDQLQAKLQAEKDPAKRAKINDQIREVNKVRLMALSNIRQNEAKYEARKEASRLKAEAMLAKPEQAARIKKMSDDVAAASMVVAGLNKKQQDLDAAHKIALQQREAADNRLGINQQRANKYASMIANAKTPSEKQLLQEAFKKAQPSLNREANSAMDALYKADRNLSAVQKSQIRVGDQILRAQKERNEIKDNLEKIKANGTMASYKTQGARETAKDVQRQIEDARKNGKVEILGGAKPDLDLAVGAGSGAKALSSGAYGTAFRKGDATIKYGKIGSEEVNAMQRAHAAGVGPQVFKGERIQGAGENAGRFAYEFVKGTPMMDKYKTTTAPTEVREEFWKQRAKIHLNYVAHNDLHPGNVVIGRDGKMTFIDFGLARVGEKAALGEALGLNRMPGEGQGGRWAFSNDGDQQAKRWGDYYVGRNKSDAPPALKKIMDNRQKVESAMIKDGLSKEDVRYFMDGGNSFRRDPGHFERANWAKMSDQAAARYLDILYDGVLS